MKEREMLRMKVQKKERVKQGGQYTTLLTASNQSGSQ